MNKTESREQNEQRPVVGVVLLVIRENKLLIGRRLEEHGFGKLSVPGGHLEYGESIEECAIRELSEETGLIATKEDVRIITLSNQPITSAHYVNIGVLIRGPEGSLRVTAPEEYTDWQWIDLDKLPDQELYDMVVLTTQKYKEDRFC